MVYILLVYILVHVLLVYNKRAFLCELIGLVIIYDESVPLQLVETAWPPTCLGAQRPSKGVTTLQLLVVGFGSNPENIVSLKRYRKFSCR